MELISGLLLALVVIGIVALVARELVGESGGEAIRKYLGDSPAADLPMLGKRGTVVDNSGVLMRVRIEGERWSANLVGGVMLPADTPVRVTAVNGLVLEVEEVAAADDAVTDDVAADTATQNPAELAD